MTSSELDFEELLKQYDYKFQKGDLVKGIVCGYDSQGVMVDIGAKTIAVVPTREAVDKDEKVEDKFEKGKEYEFLIIREEDETVNSFFLRKKLTLLMLGKNWKKLKLLTKQFSVRLSELLREVFLLKFQALEVLFLLLN